MRENKNPAHIYRAISKKIVEKVKLNINKSLHSTEVCDSSFDLEYDIMEALKYADKMGETRSTEGYLKIMQEFDKDNGNVSN